MISYPKALNIVTAAGASRALPAEMAALEEIPGRILAEDIISPRENQPFDNALMDGYALRADDLVQASATAPAALPLFASIQAGDAPMTHPMPRGHCCAIMTGAPLPAGCDAVVQIEKTKSGGKGCALFSAPVMMGTNIRRRGADIATGDIIAKKGARLCAAHILTFATLGIGEVRVIRRPRAGVIATGKELVDDLSASLQPGQIYNASTPYLLRALATAGFEVLPLGTVADAPAPWTRKVEEAQERGCDIIISTGAVSAGAHDFVPGALQDRGAEILFHKVAARPGRPTLFAQMPKNGPFVLGLPGNPVSSAAGFRFFLQPLAGAMQGLAPQVPAFAMLRAQSDMEASDLTLFLRAAVQYGQDGTLLASIIPDQLSFKVKPFAKSNAWAFVPAGAGYVKKGARVAVYMDET